MSYQKAIIESLLQAVTGGLRDYGATGAEAISSPRLFLKGFADKDAAEEFGKLKSERIDKIPSFTPSDSTIAIQDQVKEPIKNFFGEKFDAWAEENPNAAESVQSYLSDPRVAHTLGALELGLPSGARASKSFMESIPEYTPSMNKMGLNKQKGVINLFGDDKLKQTLWGDPITEALWKRHAIFDPRFDKRVNEQERLGNLKVLFDTPRRQYPEKSIFDMEGEGVVISQSDRSLEQGNLLGVNDVLFDEPVVTTGGGGYAWSPHSIETGQAWSSNEVPVLDIIKKGRQIKAITGKDPLLLPQTMTPTGIDFSKLNGEVLIKYAQKAMPPDMKKELDKAITDYKTVGSVKDGRRVNAGKQIEGWKGVDNPESIKAWNNAPDVVRKELKTKVFDKFRNKGGLSQGEARLALTDTEQLWIPDNQLNFVNRMFADEDMIPDSGNPTFPRGIRGEGVGKLKEQVHPFDLIEQLYTTGGRKVDMKNPKRNDTRLLEMQAYNALVTDKALRRVEDRINSGWWDNLGVED
jgi:hypothetical protein